VDNFSDAKLRWESNESWDNHILPGLRCPPVVKM
jgi:hypothetical protein